MLTVCLHTERLEVVPLGEADLESYCALHTDPQVMAHIAPVQDRRAALRSFSAALSFNGAAGFRRHFWFARTRTGEDVGLVALDGRERPGQAELGAVIARAAQRRGYATEVIEGLAAHAFDTLELQCLVTRHRPEHAAAIALMRRLGFSPSPTPADHQDPASQRWQLRRSDWLTRRGSTCTR